MLQTFLQWCIQVKLPFAPPGHLPGGTCPYQDVRVFRYLPWRWAGAVTEFECPVLLGSDKEVPWQEAANSQAEEDDVGAIAAVLGLLQAG